MDAVVYTVEVSHTRWEPWWTEMATTVYQDAVDRAEHLAGQDPFIHVRVTEWENGSQVRWTNYGRE